MTTRVSHLALAELPVLEPMRCTGCGDCIAVCPTSCLDLLWLLPVLARPHECVSCGLCAAVCPTQALAMMPDKTTRGGPLGPPLP
jgi:formate hydrogenlyase subunit 6/NADH:ubiquinone oxidoreductase subunit I